MAEGKQVGKVDDLVIDPERKAVGWLRLHNGGMGILRRHRKPAGRLSPEWRGVRAQRSTPELLTQILA